MSGADAVTEERLRLARDLHDGLGQHLVLLGYLVDEVVEEVSALADNEALRTVLRALRDEVTQVALELRQSLTGLRDEDATAPADELADGLAVALRSSVAELGRHSSLRVHLQLDEHGPRRPPELEREVLRIAQEAIANVHQHARAINVWVRLTSDAHRLLLVVEDDGIGHVAPREGHFGLRGMRERAERIGADLELGPRRDGGTLVRLRLAGSLGSLGSLGIVSAPITEGDGHDRPRLARR